MDIMSLFSGNKPQQPAPAAPAPAAPKNDIAAFDKRGLPANPNQPQEGVSKSPLDDYNTLFTLTEDDKKRLADQGITDKVFSVDDAKLQESVKGMSFTNPEVLNAHMQKALQGDQNSLMELLNSVAREVYARNAKLSATLSERAATTTADSLRGQLPQHMRDFAAEEGLQNLNPAYNHPAAKPMVTALKSQFSQKYPNATSGEITKMVSTYLDNFSKATKMPDPASQDSRTQNQTDVNWNNFFAGQG